MKIVYTLLVVISPWLIYLAMRAICRIIHLIKHPNDVWYDNITLTAKLAEAGYVYTICGRTYTGQNWERASVLRKGMWKSRFDALIESIKPIKDKKIRCAILSDGLLDCGVFR